MDEIRSDTKLVSQDNTEEIHKLWKEHKAAVFPGECRGIEMNGADLVLCDAYAAGCISTFIKTGALDPKRKNVLIGCIEVLQQYLPSASGPTAAYFNPLLRLSQEVLHNVSSDEG